MCVCVCVCVCVGGGGYECSQEQQNFSHTPGSVLGQVVVGLVIVLSTLRLHAYTDSFKCILLAKASEF